MRVTYFNHTDNTFRGLSHEEFLLITKHVLTEVLTEVSLFSWMILGEQTTWDVKEVSRTKNIPPTFQFIFSKNWKICCICNTCGSFLSPHVRESRFRNPGNFCLWNPKSWIFGMRNPTNDWNPESKFYWKILESSSWNPKSTAWNPESKTVLDFLTWDDS